MHFFKNSHNKLLSEINRGQQASVTKQKNLLQSRQLQDLAAETLRKSSKIQQRIFHAAEGLRCLRIRCGLWHTDHNMGTHKHHFMGYKWLYPIFLGIKSLISRLRRGHEIAYVLEVQAMHNFRVLVGTGALSDFEGVPLQ